MSYPIRGLKSIESRKKIGRPNGYGLGIYGRSQYGDYSEIAGIYRVRHYNGKKYREKMNFYPYVVTNTPAQATCRKKFADAVVAWYLLTEIQQAEYNKRAIGKHMVGKNLFIREYILYHI